MRFINLFLNKFEEIMVAICLAIAAGLTFTEVVLRYGFGDSLGYAQELTIYLLIVTGLIGASIGVRAKTHISVNILVKNFAPSIQKALSIFAYTVSALFCMIFTVLGAMHVYILTQFDQVTPEMEIPMEIPKAVVPLAFGLMMIRFLQEVYKFIKTPAEEFGKQDETSEILKEAEEMLKEKEGESK